MIILPAIDLQNGRCVRLRQGRAEDSTVYSDDPVAMALHWQEQGAQQLHVVDLDAAFQGQPVHTAVIAEIAQTLTIPVEVGGGMRSDTAVEQILAAGVARAIIGTWAFTDPTAIQRLVDKHGGDKIAVGIDARDGWVQVRGWVETTRMRALDLAKQVAEYGIGTIIYTDTATDGMLQGPNVEAMDAVCQSVPCQIIASGGVTTAEDVKRLAALKHDNLMGAIVGKALYDGLANLPDLIQAATPL